MQCSKSAALHVLKGALQTSWWLALPLVQSLVQQVLGCYCIQACAHNWTAAVQCEAQHYFGKEWASIHSWTCAALDYHYGSCTAEGVAAVYSMSPFTNAQCLFGIRDSTKTVISLLSAPWCCTDCVTTVCCPSLYLSALQLKQPAMFSRSLFLWCSIGVQGCQVAQLFERHRLRIWSEHLHFFLDLKLRCIFSTGCCVCCCSVCTLQLRLMQNC